MFTGLNFLFCAGSKTEPDLVAQTIASGGSVLTCVPRHDDDVQNVLAIGEPTDCYRLREDLRRWSPTRVKYVRPKFIRDCVACSALLDVDEYVVFVPTATTSPLSLPARRGPCAGDDWEALELAVAIDMHRAARELEHELLLHRHASGRGNSPRSRSTTDAAEWIQVLDSKLSCLIDLGATVMSSRPVK